MNQSVIFSVGVFVFMLAVWGTVMVGGLWMERFADEADRRDLQRRTMGATVGVDVATSSPLPGRTDETLPG